MHENMDALVKEVFHYVPSLLHNSLNQASSNTQTFLSKPFSLTQTRSDHSMLRITNKTYDIRHQEHTSSIKAHSYTSSSLPLPTTALLPLLYIWLHMPFLLTKATTLTAFSVVQFDNVRWLRCA